MDQPFTVRPLGLLARAADAAMNPLMRILMEFNGTPSESPQLTHRWNNHHLSKGDVSWLDTELMVRYAGIEGERAAWSLFRHLPFTGWRRYTIIEPRQPARWYPGWISGDAVGVSRIPQDGKVRLLLGPREVRFFGIDVLTGRQVPV